MRPAAASSAPRPRRFSAFLTFKRLRRLDESAPVFERLRRMAVDLQPGERLVEGATVHQASARPRREVKIQQTTLQGEDVSQPLDIASGQRKQTERKRRFLFGPSVLV